MKKWYLFLISLMTAFALFMVLSLSYKKPQPNA